MPLSNSAKNEVHSSATFVVGATQPASLPPDSTMDGFVDRRLALSNPAARGERRQFGSSHFGLSDDARDLALAIDQYKLQHHRRYLTCDELLSVITSLGYQK